MASQMEWSHDFCLFCDRQISGGAYCSQACRVGDLEKAAGGLPSPVSPVTRSSMSSASSSWSAAQGMHSGSGLALPPPINFAAYRNSNRSESTPSSPQHYTPRGPVYFQHSGTGSGSRQSSHSASSSSKSGLTPSSSRASLSSLTTSAASSQGLSDQAASQLRGYSDAFDQVREMRRRMTYA